MKYNHDRSRAKEYTNLALKRLEKEGLAPTPHNIELWYVYYANMSPEVKRAIDILAGNEQEITQERCSEIYQRFLSPVQTEEIVRKAGDKIQKTLDEVSEFVSQVKFNTSNFSGTLENASEQIGAASSINELESMMRGLVKDTEEMIEHNQHLEKELDRSSSEMIELQSNLETVRKEAYTDGLTGLKNRKAFDEEFEKIVAECQEEGGTFSLLMVDIDHFKEFNDTYGHQIGDQVLRLVARTLTDGVKGRDVACRFGGEEFSILLPDTDAKGATTVADTLRKAISTKEIVNRVTQDKLGKITISIGVAEYINGEDTEQTLERADAALYTAKRSGRNRVAVSPQKQGKASVKAG